MPRPAGQGHVILVVGLLLVAIILIWIVRARLGGFEGWRPFASEPADGYLLTVWNVENLYDDQDDPDDPSEIEGWFARDHRALREKHRLLVEALLAPGDHRGPDLLMLVEVENRRAVELLRLALNAALPSELAYPARGLIHRDLRTGRRIEPALLSRLPVKRYDVLDFGAQRTLATRVEVGDAPLILIGSHWTSRATADSESKRIAYADALYRAFLTEYRLAPAVDLIVCGDFNTEPGSIPVVDHLRAIGDQTSLVPGDPQPYLLDLMAGLDPDRDGTYFYRGRWEILDFMTVSPGLLDDRGWTVRTNSLRVRNAFPLRGGRRRGPLRFGDENNPNARGPSDHFAVSVRMTTKPPTADPPQVQVAGISSR